MNHLKTSPVGIDYNIDRIQKAIYPVLLEKWEEVDVYGRAYKNQKGNNIKLEVYAANGDYKPILFKEKNKVFFVQGNKPKIEKGTVYNDLWVVAVVDLKKVRPSIAHRADEEVHSDLLNALYNEVKIESVLGLEYGLDSVKRVVEDTFSFDNFNTADIHPHHVFMVKLSVKYYLEEINC